MRYGLAVKDIVPPFPMPMYGYGGREDVFDGVNDPMVFTALVLEEDGRRALIGATDIGSYPNDGRTPELMERLAEAVRCAPGSVMLNASHTHGGPLVPMSSSIHKADSRTATMLRYEDWLFDQLAEAACEAASDLRDGSLWYGEGTTTVPMNRRPDRDGAVPNAPNPGGPTDDRLCVFAIRDGQGTLAAVGMRVSCHPVATGAQHLLTADYPGAWRAELARAFGRGVTPFFLQGVGADARPQHVADGDRWRAMKHDELIAIGSDLLHECLAVLTGAGMRELGPLVLEGRFEPVDLPCERRYLRRADFEGIQDPGLAGYARLALDLLAAGEPVPDHRTFHVQTLWLTDAFALIGIDGEVLCGTGAAVEAAVAPRKGLVLGYTNGVISYLPNAEEMARGGYETQCYRAQPWTGPLKSGLEDLLAAGVWRR